MWELTNGETKWPIFSLPSVGGNGRVLGCSGLSFKARVKILVSYETRKPKESIGTNHVILACQEGG